MHIYIYREREMHTHMCSYDYHYYLHRLPDGVGTNGVFAEAPLFPVLRREMWLLCENSLLREHVATCDNT